MQEVFGSLIPPLLDGVREQLIPASVILLRIAWVERAILYSNLVCDKIPLTLILELKAC